MQHDGQANEQQQQLVQHETEESDNDYIDKHSKCIAMALDILLFFLQNWHGNGVGQGEV